MALVVVAVVVAVVAETAVSREDPTDVGPWSVSEIDPEERRVRVGAEEEVL